jgi:hypothetical protein
MDEKDVDNIFKDFETRVKEKKESSQSQADAPMSDEEKLKIRYRKAEDALKDQYKKQKEDLEKRKAEEMLKMGKLPAKSLDKIERYAYIAVIAVLLIYVVADLAFYHGSKDSEQEIEQPAANIPITEEENQSAGAEEVQAQQEEEKVNDTTPVQEEVPKEEPEQDLQLSGKITLTIDRVYTSINENDETLGEISQVVFTIDNGKDKVLTPLVQVFAYDTETKEDWETKERGTYISVIGIKPGDKKTASVYLSPKMFRDLNVQKNIRLTLNDTTRGFITSASKTVTIS